MAKKLGRYNEDNDWYDYKMDSKESLFEFLENMVENKIVMWNKKDRKELISKMDVKQNGHLRKSLRILNAALKEAHLPYIIKEKDLKDDNGKRHQRAWIVESWDWSVKTE